AIRHGSFALSTTSAALHYENSAIAFDDGFIDIDPKPWSLRDLHVAIARVDRRPQRGSFQLTIEPLAHRVGQTRGNDVQRRNQSRPETGGVWHDAHPVLSRDGDRLAHCRDAANLGDARLENIERAEFDCAPRFAGIADILAGRRNI